MAKKKLTITSVPKAIRKDVKSLLRNSDGFQVAIVYVNETTGTVGTATRATSGLAGLIGQAARNYEDIANAIRTAYDEGQKAA